MKPTLRTLPHLVSFLLLGFLAGGLAWEILERLLALTGILLDLRIGPVSLEAGFLQMNLWLTPGGVLGSAGGVSLFMAVK